MKRMHKITPAWIDAQIEKELDRECCASAVYDLAALVTVRNYLHGMQHDGVMAPMRDNNVINIGDYRDNRQSGMLSAVNDEGENMRQYGRRYSAERVDHVAHQPHTMEYSDGQDGNHLTREAAEQWVKGMKSEDGKTGGRWPLHEIKQYAANFGIQGEEEIIEFFAVMNALYTDYCKVAKKFGVDKVDFWADLAKAFMHDKDAGEGKVKKYYECIAKHDDD